MISTQDLPTVNDEKKKYHRRRRSIIREFSLNTSTHGLPGIARSESIHNRVFWTISFLGFTAIMIYFITKAILNYLEYPTQVNINIVSEWPQNFPAISLCNSSPFRYDRFIGSFLNYTNTMNWTRTQNASAIPENLMAYLTQFLVTELNANRSLDSIYYSLPSILRKCVYNAMPCSAADFIPFYSSFYGLCYTFNAKMKNSTNDGIRNGNENGGNGILDLELYAHSHQYIPDFWRGAGFVALIHHNNQAPLIESAGIFLTPGRQHKLNFKKKAIFLLPAPYSSCIDAIPPPMKITFDSYYHGADYGYSEVVCHGLCAQAYIYEQCGCINPLFWSFRSLMLPDTQKIVLAPLCYPTFFNACYNEALNIFLKSTSLQTKYCSYCSQQCTTIQFLIEKSALISPLDWQLQGIKAFVENSTIPVPSDWSTAWQDHIQKNYLSVSFTRETTTVENITQSAQMTVVDVISNIGGQTGLWIGISFLSFMEFIEMLYRLIRYQCHVIKTALRREQQIIPT